MIFSRLRQYLPMRAEKIIDDRETLKDCEAVLIDWPYGIPKPRVGVFQDYGTTPYWTRYVHFLEANAIPYGIYPIHDHNWIEKADEFDVIIGKLSNSSYELEEIREKTYTLECHLGKLCFPDWRNVLLYENKKLETYLSKIYGFPFIPTYVSHDRDDALRLIEGLKYPIVSKVVPSSGSLGVELVQTKKQAKSIVEQAFSNNGRIIHVLYERQKNFVYFQDFIPNDGYDIRVIMVGRRVFGFYRRVLRGDFRASGMKLEEKRGLPDEAMRIARSINRVIKSPQLVVDFLHGQDGNYYIGEISPLCGITTRDELAVNDVSGAYIFEEDDSYSFEPGKHWLQEFALCEFFSNYYLPFLANGNENCREPQANDLLFSSLNE